MWHRNSPEKKDKVVRLYMDGLSVTAIIERTGMSRTLVCSILKKQVGRDGVRDTEHRDTLNLAQYAHYRRRR